MGRNAERGGESRRSARLPGPRGTRCGASLRAHGEPGLECYLAEIARHPLLTEEQERTLGTRACAGDEEARRTLIECNLRLVVSIALDYHSHELALLDLIQEGNIGLLHAVERYVPRDGSRFASYAGWWIRQAISRALHEQDNPLSVPEYRILAGARTRRLAVAYEVGHGHPPTDDELMALANLTRADLAALRRLPELHPLSLDEPERRGPPNDTMVGELPTRGELVLDLAEPMEEQVERADEAQRLRALVRSRLTPREREVIERRYLGERQPLREVGLALGISIERARQIEAQALAHLRSVLAREDEEAARVDGERRARPRHVGGRRVVA